MSVLKILSGLRRFYRGSTRDEILRIPRPQLVVYDFDGVLTDNRVVLREDGFESVIVNRSDGLAISLLKGMGISQVILTTETNSVVQKRAEKLQIPIVKGIGNKKEALLAYCEKVGASLDSVVYIGNDINDLEAMKCVGFPICPADAYSEIKNISRLVLCAKGGYGVVREFLTYLQ